MNDIERETAIELFEWLEKEHPQIMSYGVGIEALKMVGQIEAMKAEIEELAVLGDARPNISDGYHNAMNDVLEVVHKYYGGKTDENTD